MFHNAACTNLVPQVFQYLDLYQRLMVKALLVSNDLDSYVAAHLVVKTPEHLQAPRVKLRIVVLTILLKQVSTCTDFSMQVGWLLVLGGYSRVSMAAVGCRKPSRDSLSCCLILLAMSQLSSTQLAV